MHIKLREIQCDFFLEKMKLARVCNSILLVSYAKLEINIHLYTVRCHFKAT